MIQEKAYEEDWNMQVQFTKMTKRLNAYAAPGRLTAKVGKQAIPMVGAIASGGLGSFVMGKLSADSITSMGGSIFDFASGKILALQEQQLGIAQLQKAQEWFVAEFQQQITNTLCFNDAEMHLVGADTQLKRIERAKLDLSRALLKFQNNQKVLDRLIVEGRRRVQNEKARDRASLWNNIWEDLYEGNKAEHAGKVSAHRTNMRRAQRMLYLVVRAVEYEWQVSSKYGPEVLKATTPAQLETVLTAIRADIGTGGIGGQPPEDRHVELSLKKQLLQLAGREGWPVGQHTLSDTRRFQALLTSPRYAHYDKSGAYDGQLIPFSIAPLGVLSLGDAGSIPILAGSQCGERIWSVNMTLHGENLMTDGATYTSVQLLKKNTFYSQWCSDPGSGAPLQMSSVRPSLNLFNDPVEGGSVGTSNTNESEYARALVDAYFNVSRADFEKESYSEGSSEELAARALYGGYALFFPKERLSIDGSSGLRLNRIEDILLRFDYVSAAKAWK